VAAVGRPRSDILVQALFLLALACRVEGPPWVDGEAAGGRAPDFTLPDLLGNRVSLADHRGRPVILDFWATWCAPCAQQIPVLNDFQAAHYGEVVVLGIAVDPQGIEVVAPYANEHDIRYPVLVGSESLSQAYGAFGFPSLYVIAPDGSIAANHVGVITREELEEALVAAAARGGPETP
jgi:cytochrome c biogenesis protein CcmG/thiol:disulfide interchange protein DsbE